MQTQLKPQDRFNQLMAKIIKKRTQHQYQSLAALYILKVDEIIKIFSLHQISS